MSSELKTNKISPATGTALQIGDSGDTITIASGATLSGADMGLASVQVFTSSGTWNRPTGITKVVIHVVGGGGGGGGGRSAYNYTRDVGGAGGLAIKFLDVSSISSSTITVGAATSEAAVDSDGADGNNSSWADGTNTITANGGGHGDRGGDTIFRAGGSASGGDINVTGGSGSCQPQGQHNDAGKAAGRGGVCAHGFGGGPGASIATNSNNNATGYGHGGSGGPTNSTGGSGAPGIVIVWEYK